DAKGRPCGLQVEAVAFGERPHRGEDSEGPCPMKAAVVVAYCDCQPDFAAYLDAQHIGLKQGAAGQRACPRSSAARRQNDGARMGGHQRQHVIEVEGMAEGPVGEGREFRRGCPATPQDGTGTALTALLDVAQERWSDLAARTGKDDRKRVGDCLLRPVKRLRRKVLERLL